MDNGFELGAFAGRFHLVLLHLPIGFLAVLLIIEAVAWMPPWRGARDATGPVLLLAAVGAWLTACLGWLLAEADGYEGALLAWHRWTGVGAAVLTLPLLVTHLMKKRRAYLLLLGATMGLTVIAGHFGGSLTHGRGFLTEHAPGWLKISSNKDAPADGALRVLDTYCVGCHGEEKHKAGLRLDSREAILAGGESGPAVVPGEPEESRLLQRMSLPLDDDDHMPPDGNPQPAPEEVQLVHEWILEGAMD